MFGILIFFWTLEFCVSLLGLIFHFVAFYNLLQMINSSNQVLLLSKMTLLGMASIIIAVSTDVVRVLTYLEGSNYLVFTYLDIFLQHAFSSKLLHLYDFLYTFFHTDFIFTTILLIADRLASLLCPIRYDMWMSRRTVVRIISGAVIVSAINSVLLTSLNQIHQVFWYQVISLTAVVFVLALMTYIKVALMLSAAASKDSHSIPQHIKGKKSMKILLKKSRKTITRNRFILNTLIVITYVTSYYLPTRVVLTCARYLSPHSTRVVFHDAIKLISSLAYVCNPVLYIFITKRLQGKSWSQRSSSIRKKTKDGSTLDMFRNPYHQVTVF